MVEMWNTGRHYNYMGQPIAAEIVDGMVFFVDYGREIAGQYIATEESEEDLPADVMRHYDENAYKMGSSAEIWARTLNINPETFPMRKF